MSLHGSQRGPWFGEVRRLLLTWLPEAEDQQVPDSDMHWVMTHPVPIAASMDSSFRRNQSAASAGQGHAVISVVRTDAAAPTL